jgi:hypothetical protein
MASKPTLKLRGVKMSNASATELHEFGAADLSTPFLPSVGGAAAAAPLPKVTKPKASAPASVGGASSAAPLPKPKAQPLTQVEGASASAAEEAKQIPSDVNISKYDETLQDYAIDILGQEHDNPYRDKSISPVFPLQSRLGFQQQILRVYAQFIKIPEHGKAPDFDACKKLDAGAQQQLEMYEYQKFVREYVRQASPYRGVLVYHGLGSGKTCSSIAAAEALFSVNKKRIIVMTPFSLRDNFIREITFCGFRHFRTNNFWVELDSSTAINRVFAKEILGLPDEFISRAPQIWVPDFNKPANFEELQDSDRQQITKQLNMQINTRIQFINYNGITATKLKEIACRPRGADGQGYFDDAVIIVDEIHNLTRLMQGTIEPYLTAIPGLKRKVPLEPVTYEDWSPALCKKTTDPRKPYLTNYKRGFLLYRLLEGARNSKIIGLSGTPLINFPEEIAILINLLGGYIHTAAFTISPGSEANLKTVKDILLTHPRVDFEEVELQGLNISVLMTILPEGMVKAEGGVRKEDGKFVNIKQVVDEVIALIKAKGLKIFKAPEFKSESLLPPNGQEFRENFLEADGTTLKNSIVLRKRLQGLISYYKGSKKELMPTVTKDVLIKVPLSPYAQAEYQRIRGEELQQQLQQKQKPQQAVAGMVGKMGNLWAELYDLAKMKSPNSYRMFSRQSCNFAFPEGITRPRPRNQQEAIEEIGKDKEIILDDEQVITEEDATAEDAALEEDAAIDKGEKEEGAASASASVGGGGSAAAAAAEEDEEEQVLIKELPAVPQEGELKPAAAASEGGGAKPTLTALNVMKLKQAKEAEECKKGLASGEAYLVATKRAKRCLEIFATPRLRLFPRGKKVQEEITAGAVPDPNSLMKYSPKFANILSKILEAPGSSLVYSQFLDMEGIGIFLVVLKINEFKPIVIENEGGKLRFSAETVKSLKLGPGVNRYLSFTGSEPREIRTMALRVFNAKFNSTEGRFTDLTPEMSQVLVESGFTGNMKGELCRVFCITSAGAEGLSLRNVRRVHIMEPYWNPVRTDQVKGRAVRICSHIDLEYSEDPTLNQRTVEVYTYCSVFDTEALLKPDGSSGFPRIDQTILNGDGMKAKEAVEVGFVVAEGVKDYVVTSDEYLYSLSERKKKLLQNIQNLMKTSAVDCQINEYENEDDQLACITLPGNPSNYAYHPILKKDIAETSTALKLEPVVQEAAAAAGGGAGAAGAAPAEPRKRPVIQARELKHNGVIYLAVPVLNKGQVIPLSYDLYGRGDVSRRKRLGTSVANGEGLPTKDIVITDV